MPTANPLSLPLYLGLSSKFPRFCDIVDAKWMVTTTVHHCCNFRSVLSSSNPQNLMKRLTSFVQKHNESNASFIFKCVL